MRWSLAVAGIALAGTIALGRNQLRTLIATDRPADLPSLIVRRHDLSDTAVAIGTIRAKVGAEVKVGSRLSGVVSELNVQVGDRVSKGDRLASLSDADWRARVGVLRAQLDSAVAEKEYAEAELARTDALADLVPQLQLDRARKDVKVREADVRRIRASLDEANVSLGYTVIRAPVSGTVASVSTYKGETIAASFAAPTFVTLIDLDRLEVQTFVDETDIGRIRTGQPVTLRVDAFPGVHLEGVVSAIYPKAQLVNNVVNYVVIVDVIGSNGLALRPEMTVHVDFVLESRAEVVAIPRAALLRRNGRSLVIVRLGDEWIERQVNVGLQTSQLVEIASGLHEGETILADRSAWKQEGETEP